jgi:hypothetical protein
MSVSKISKKLFLYINVEEAFPWLRVAMKVDVVFTVNPLQIVYDGIRM